MTYQPYFNKNAYNLKDKDPVIRRNKSLKSCQEYAIHHKKSGFEYEGNHNMCLLYGSTLPDVKLNDDVLNNFNVSKYNKTRTQKDASLHEQYKSDFYFDKINHYNMQNKNPLTPTKKNVYDLQECQKECMKNNKCKSILYLKQPEKCTFYNSIQFGKFSPIKKNIDIYTLNQNKLKNNNIELIFNEEEEYKEKNIKDKNKNNNDKRDDLNVGYEYTKCFTNDKYNSFNTTKKSYDKICGRQFGDEYKFANIQDDKNIIECDNKEHIQIKCVPQYIEHFTTKKNHNSILLWSCIFIIGLMYIIYFLKIK